jgi:branched-chain amino acid transport system substrate-binding protein
MKMKIVKLLNILLVGVLVLFLSGEGFSQTKGPIKIGSLSALTGVGSQMGQNQRDALVMVFDKVNAAGGINGQKIELYIEDDQLQPTVAVNAAKKLVYKDEVLLIIGTVNSPTALAAIEVTMEAKVPQLAIGVAPKITQMNNPWIARIIPVDTILGSHLANFAVNEKKFIKLAVLHDSTDYGKGGMASVVDALKKLNLTPLIIETFNNEDKDFSSQLNKIKNSGADGLIIWGLHVQGAQIINQAKKLGLTMPIFGSSGILQGNFLDLAKENAEGAYFVSYFSLDNPDPKVQTFVKEVRDRFKYDPTPVSAIAYELANLVVMTLRKTGPDRTKFMEAFKSMPDYVGVTGRVSADPRGEMGRGGVILQIKGYKPVTVWAAK